MEVIAGCGRLVAPASFRHHGLIDSMSNHSWPVGLAADCDLATRPREARAIAKLLLPPSIRAHAWSLLMLLVESPNRCELGAARANRCLSPSSVRKIEARVAG